MLQDTPPGPLYTSYKRHAYEGLLPFRYVTSGESGNTHIQKIKKLVHQRENNIYFLPHSIALYLITKAKVLLSTTNIPFDV